MNNNFQSRRRPSSSPKAASLKSRSGETLSLDYQSSYHFITKYFNGLASTYSFRNQRRKRPDYSILITVAALLSLGTLTLYAIGPAVLTRTGAGLGRQTLFLGLGSILLYLAYKFRHLSMIVRFAPNLFLLALLLNLAILSPLGKVVYGGRRWLDLGFLSFQPSELLKASLVFLFAGILVYFGDESSKIMNNKKKSFTILGIFGGIAFLVLFLQRDLGTMLVFSVIAAFMMIYSKLNSSVIVRVVTTGSLLFLLSILTFGYRRERLFSYLGLSQNQSSTVLQEETASEYHLRQSLIAIGSGGLYGKGVGKSVQSFGYLPEAPSDSIFAIFAEKFGLIGSLIVLGLFYFLVRRLNLLAKGLDGYWGLVTIGISGWITGNLAVNLGSILGIIPFTGVPLPFFSLGGTNLVIILIMIGIALNLSTYKKASIK